MTSTTDIAREEVKKIDFEALRKAGIERTLEDFYILGNYPPLTAMDDCCEDELLADNTQKEMDVYLHFQFCEQLCNFCHFYMDQRARSNEDPRVTRYLDNLKREISMLNEKIGGIKARSIYVGGGTPTFMSERQIRDLFSHLYSEIEVPQGTTITFDAHPEVVRGHLHKLDVLKEVGVNRVSIGGVDLNDEVLLAQQRGHNSRETIRLIQELKLRGFSHVVTDLMMGVQYQTAENWEATLDTLVGDVCQIDGAMTFPLMFKASQINWHQYKRDSSEFPTVTDRAVMQLVAMRTFQEVGYSHEPIYYFNRGQEHINDQQVRKFESLDETGLLPIGISAFGFINGHQYFNTPYIEEYHQSIESGKLPVWKSFKLSPRHKFERAVMFSLKSKGLNKRKIEEKYGFSVDIEYAHVIKRLEEVGLLESTSDYLRLTQLGILFAEEVCDKFAGEDIRRKAEERALLVSPNDPIQRYNYNMIGHRLR